MKTLWLSANEPTDIAAAGEIIRNGGLVVIPTETVYGLAANALDADAVERIFAAKGRPTDNPLIVHISDLSQLDEITSDLPKAAMQLAEAFWPGPLTLVLPKKAVIPDITSGGLDTVAVRLPAFKAAREIIDAAGVPLAAPSANRSGRPSPTTFKHALEEMDDRVDAVMDGGYCAIGLESTVIGFHNNEPVILRPGQITKAQVESIAGSVNVDPSVTERLKQGALAVSPGMKYQHYSPDANIILVDASPKEYVKFVNAHTDSHALCFQEDIEGLCTPYTTFGKRYDLALQAKSLFGALRALDEANAQTVYARMPTQHGLGLAVFNRLIRAAAYQTINPGNHYVLGLTGQSGAGKTSVANRLKQLGCCVIDCDAETRDSGVYDQACLTELSAAFGQDIIVHGQLDRRALAKRAFTTAEGKSKLNAITHPRIMRRLINLLHQHLNSGEKIIVFDAPTLFDAGLDQWCGRIIAVEANEETRLRRIMQRDGLNSDEATQRLRAQPQSEFYHERADYVIYNDEKWNIHEQIDPIIHGLFDALKIYEKAYDIDQLHVGQENGQNRRVGFVSTAVERMIEPIDATEDSGAQ